MKTIALLVSCALLSACSATPVRERVVVKVKTVEVKVEVPVACIDRKPLAPIYEFGVGPVPANSADAAKALVSDFEAAWRYGAAWEAAAAGCATKN